MIVTRGHDDINDLQDLRSVKFYVPITKQNGISTTLAERCLVHLENAWKKNDWKDQKLFG